MKRNENGILNSIKSQRKRTQLDKKKKTVQPEHGNTPWIQKIYNICSPTHHFHRHHISTHCHLYAIQWIFDYSLLCSAPRFYFLFFFLFNRDPYFCFLRCVSSTIWSANAKTRASITSCDVQRLYEIHNVSKHIQHAKSHTHRSPIGNSWLHINKDMRYAQIFLVHGTKAKWWNDEMAHCVAKQRWKNSNEMKTKKKKKLPVIAFSAYTSRG